MNNPTLCGIDVAKEKFQIQTVNHTGRCLTRRRLHRSELVAFVSQLPRTCTIAMEACGGTHYWARTFGKLGFKAVLIPAQFVRPFRKGLKSDASDAEAICIAARQPQMRFVTPKTEQHQVIQMVHTIRRRLISNRTQLVNQIRSFLLEFGVTLPTGINFVRRKLSEVLHQHQELPEELVAMIRDLQSELSRVDEEVAKYDKRIAHYAKTDPQAASLRKLPGVGPVTATAAVYMASSGGFKNGRSFSASVGLVPNHFNSGNRERLGHITKKGDCYFRALLVHGARAAIRAAVVTKRTDEDSLWMRKLHDNKEMNLAAVAMANKTARRIWAILAGKQEYRQPSAA